MEKTILYSKKSSSVVHNLDVYESCEHEHCKQLLAHIKFLSNALTQKAFKEEHSSNENILKPKSQNIPQNVVLQSEFTKAIEEEIEQIKKNYLKLKKQLNQVETENDELFEENQQLKKKIEKLTDQVNKFTFELSVTKSHVDTKNSFYQPSTTHRNSCDIDSKEIENVAIYPRSVDLCEQNIILPTEYSKEQEHTYHSSTIEERTEIYERYEKLIKENAKLENEMGEKEESFKLVEKRLKTLEYENMQLKKIIKLRNEIQIERHKTINGLKNVINEIMA